MTLVAVDETQGDKPMKLAVLISGTGSNLEALLSALDRSELPGAEVVIVGADREAEGLQHASIRGIPTFTVPFRDYSSRALWGEALLEALRASEFDYLILSGLMRLLPKQVLDAYPNRIINTHPAYLPEFPGAHAVRDALAAGVTETGASVIEVAPGVDDGPILARERIPVLAGDTEEALHGRIKIVERRLLLQVLKDLQEKLK